MSSSSSPTTYLLDVDIQLDKATGQLVNFRERSKAEMTAAAAGMQAPLAQVEVAAQRAATATSSVGSSVGAAAVSFRGLAPTILTATNALSLMGATGVPAIGALTRGVTALAAGGFTPLGVALGIATTALSFFIGRSNETTKAVEQQQEAVEELVKSYGDLIRARSDPLIARSREGRAGPKPTTLQEMRAAESELVARLGVAEEDLATSNQDTFREMVTRVQAVRNALTELRLEIAQLQAQSAKAPALPEDLPFSFTAPRGRRSSSDALATMFNGGVPTLTADQLAHMPRGGTVSRTPPEIGDWQSTSMFGPSRSQLAELSGGYYVGTDQRTWRSSFEEGAVPPAQQRAIDARAEAEAEAYARALAKDTETMRSFGERGAASITSALNTAITSGDFSSFFSQFQAGITDAVVAAFTYSLVQKPLESALGGLTQNVGGFLGTGVSPGGYGGDAGPAAGYASEVAGLSAAKSARLSPRNVTLLVGDGANVNIGQGGGRGGSAARRPR